MKNKENKVMEIEERLETWLHSVSLYSGAPIAIMCDAIKFGGEWFFAGKLVTGSMDQEEVDLRVKYAWGYLTRRAEAALLGFVVK